MHRIMRTLNTLRTTTAAAFGYVIGPQGYLAPPSMLPRIAVRVLNSSSLASLAMGSPQLIGLEEATRSP
jgi:hypothetical protein